MFDIQRDRCSCDDGSVMNHTCLVQFSLTVQWSVVRLAARQYTAVYSSTQQYIAVYRSTHHCWSLSRSILNAGYSTTPFLSTNSFVSRFPQAFYIIPFIDTDLVLSIYYMSNAVLCLCMAACLVTFCFIHQYIYTHTCFCTNALPAVDLSSRKLHTSVEFFQTNCVAVHLF